MGIVGRADALAPALALFDAASGPAALVYSGEAGIGKTAVWEAALAEARGRSFTVFATRPGEADAAVAFSGLVDLLEGVADRTLELLPRPQRVALRAAVFDTDARADWLPLGMAVRNVLRQVALRAPVVIAVDDLQWLDVESAQVLEFALRRLDADPVLLVATVRAGVAIAFDPTAAFAAAAVRRTTLGRLRREDVGELLEQRLGFRLGRARLAILDDACDGNPLFALELGRSVQAGTTDLSAGRPVALAASLRELIAARVAAVPAELRDELLTVAALHDPRVGAVDPRVLTAGEQLDLLVLDGDRVRFTHPLVRATVYDRARGAARRACHLQLAGRVEDAVERAFHLALGTVVPDEAVAAVIEVGARDASRRDARLSAAKLLEHAARLTPDRATRVRWRLDAVEKCLWGARDEAHEILRVAEAEVEPGPLRARATYLRSFWIESHPESERLLADASDEADDETLVLLLLERGYRHLHSRSFRAGNELARRALEIALRTGRRELVVAATARTMRSDMAVGVAVDHEQVRQALALEGELNAEGIEPLDSVRKVYGQLLTYAGELAVARPLLEQHLRRARESGYPPWALPHLAMLEWRAGNFELARRSAAEFTAEGDLDPDDAASAPFYEAWPLASLGFVDEALAALDAAQAFFMSAQESMGLVGCHSIRGFVWLSLDRDEDAAREYLRGIELMRELGWREVGVHAIYQHCAQALVALGRLPEAEALLDEVEAIARPLGRVPTMAGVLRARATLAAAVGAYELAAALGRESLQLQSTLPEPFELAHTRLVLGTVLRRAQRKAEARAELEHAAAEFKRMKTPLWHAKATAELRRIGGRAPAGGLTATEQRVAALVAAGRTNQEVASALFVSPKTVEWNLSKIYRKLRVSSRVELAVKLAGRDATPRSN